MSIKYTPLKRFTDPGERTLDAALDSLSQGTAIIEPETVGSGPANSDDFITAVEALAVGTAYTTTKSGAETVTAGGVLELSDEFTAPDDATVHSVVVPANNDANIYYKAYILVKDIDGSLNPVVKYRAYNMTSSNQTVADATPLYYTVITDTSIDQPKKPNAALTVTPGIRWLDDSGNPLGLPLSITNLNSIANPTLAIPAGSVTAIELNSSFIKNLAAQYIGHRTILTVASDKTVAWGTAVLMGTVSFVGSTGPRVRVGNLGLGPLFTGYVSATNGVTTVSVYARSTLSGITQHVPAGTQLKVLVS